MKFLAGLAVIASMAAIARTQPPDINVNSRYTVEDVRVDPERRLSRTLREDLRKLVGEKFNQATLDALRERLKQETGARVVSQKVVRGDKAETVQVVFELRYGKHGIDVNIPKAVYASRLGWSGAMELEAHWAGNTVGFGVADDGDALVERFAGIRAYYERKELWGRRFGFRFDAEDWHDQWNRTTMDALGSSMEPYRSRTSIQPVLTVRLWGPLTWSGGVNFQNLETPNQAAPVQGAHSVVQILRLRQQWSESGLKQTVEAGYGLRAATNLLSSDFVYARHQFDASYKFQDGPHEIIVRAVGGAISGNAPMFERFVAGNTTVLRGYSKWDLTPAGATRLAAGTLEYRNHGIGVFYDTGTAWDDGGAARVHHSLGCGYTTRKGLMVAVAFPMRGDMFPMFFAGINF